MDKVGVDGMPSFKEFLSNFVPEVDGEWDDSNSTPNRESSSNEIPKSEYVLLIYSEFACFGDIG